MVLTVTGRVSNHNSEQDDTDRATWQRFVGKVNDLARDPEFTEIDIDLIYSGE